MFRDVNSVSVTTRPPELSQPTTPKKAGGFFLGITVREPCQFHQSKNLSHRFATRHNIQTAKRMDPEKNTDANIINHLAAKVEATQVVKRTTAAKILDCHPSFISSLCADGKLQTIKLGPHCSRITLKSINDFLSSAKP